MSVLLYVCETWTLRKREKDSLLAFEMRCYRRILHIRGQQKITNVEIRRRLEIKRNVDQLIMDWKLKLFGHICRMDDNRLVKVVVFGIMDGKNKREDQAGNALMTQKNGVTLSSAWRRIDHNGGGLSTKHWTPTGACPQKEEDD